MDLLYYLHDIFDLKIEKLNQLLTYQLTIILNQNFIQKIKFSNEKFEIILSFFIFSLQFHIFNYPSLIGCLFSQLFLGNPKLFSYFNNENFDDLIALCLQDQFDNNVNYINNINDNNHEKNLLTNEDNENENSLFVFFSFYFNLNIFNYYEYFNFF